MRRARPFVVGVLAAIGLAGGVASASPTSVAQGRRLAQANCSGCHAIAGRAPSPMPDAPRFPDLERLSEGRGVDEIFAQGLMTGHPPMPTFLGDDQAMADLLDYIRSVQARPPHPPGGAPSISP